MSSADDVHRMLVAAVRGATPTYDPAMPFTVEDDGEGRGVDVAQMVRGARWAFTGLQDDDGGSVRQRRMRADLRLTIYYPDELRREPARARIRAASDAALLNERVPHPDLAGWGKPILTVETEGFDVIEDDGELTLEMNFYALYLGDS